ncbi:hypothetical protein PVK06_048397 [Gossypium arboreum]|uniref:Uncharacterized protein n=1 Tax=Gossypium arboreum TaxID=29729 RepID=A0ABR0MFU7_GOSAR|nr:hypothetical protein PVK06_048397 [Gossypium arboreum]
MDILYNFEIVSQTLKHKIKGSNNLGRATTDSQSIVNETPTQSAEKVPATLAEATKGTKRKRGSTNMKDIWNLQPGTRIVVDANQYGQPIGKETSKLVEFLGTIAKTGSIYPLNTKHWKHLSKYMLENILRIFHEKFDLQGKVEDSDILSHVGKLQKEFKSTLKTRYYEEMVQEGRPIEEIYENNPPSAQSEKAKKSQTKVRYAHTAGSTRYATLNAQFDEKEGREPSHLEQFRFQHLHKDGSEKLSSEAVKQVYAAERESRLIVEAEERFMKLTKIREAKFMDMMDAREKKYKALINECMAKGMSIEFQSSGLDDKAFSSDDDE